MAKPAKSRPAPASSASRTEAPPPGQETSIENALRAWRRTEAKRKGVPAFRILTDRALQAIASTQPQTTRELLELPGVGLRIVEKYGAQIFRIVGRA